jgi:hypothetical protein
VGFWHTILRKGCLGQGQFAIISGEVSTQRFYHEFMAGWIFFRRNYEKYESA